MTKLFALIVAVALGCVSTSVAATGGNLTVWVCNTNNCSTMDGNYCATVQPIPLDVCISGPRASRKVHCMRMPKAKCIQQTVYSGDSCDTPVQFVTSQRCGACLPSGPNGAWGVIDCSKAPSIHYRYNCNAGCSVCTSVLNTTVGTCGSIEGYFYNINAVVSCPSVIFEQMFNTTSCTGTPELYSFVAGRACLGQSPQNGGYEFECPAARAHFAQTPKEITVMDESITPIKGLFQRL